MNILLNSDTRTRKVNINILLSLLIKGISMICGFILVPLTINYVNPVQYGIWLTLSSVIGWLGLCDIGLANGLRNKLSEAKTKGDLDIAKCYVSTTYIVLGAIFLFVLIIFSVINFFIDWSVLLNAPKYLSSELTKLSFIVVFYFCLIFVLRILSMVVTADQKISIASALDMFSQIISLVLIYVLTKSTVGSLIYLGLSFVLSPIVVYTIANIFFYNSIYKDIAPSFKYFNKGIGKELLKMGYKFFVPQISSVVVCNSLLILIAQIGTPLDVTNYNIAFKLNNLFLIITTIVVSPYWSAYTEAYVKRDILWMVLSMKKLRLFFIVLLIGSLIMLFFSNEIYHIWLGDKVKIPGLLSFFVFVYVIEQVWIQIHLLPLNGIGRLAVQYYSSIFEMIVNIPLALLLGKIWGIYGVILAPIIISSLRCIWTPIQLYKLIYNKASGVWNK